MKRMKKMKKFVSLLLTALMVFAMAAPVFAEGDQRYSITINNTSDTVSMEGNTYRAYKLFNVTYSENRDSYAYTIADEFKDFTYEITAVEDPETGDNMAIDVLSGESLISYLVKLKVDGDSEGVNKISVALNRFIEENTPTPSGFIVVGEDVKSVTIPLEEPGYYIVSGTGSAADDQTVTALCALTTTDPTANVNLKADAPTIDKKIDAKHDTDTTNGEEPVKNNNVSIGDEIPFIVTSKVPDMTGYEKYYFVVTDTMAEGLTFLANEEITVGSDKLVEGIDYDITVSKNVGQEDDETGGNMAIDVTGPTTIEIVFKDFIKYAKGQVIEIKYSAVLNDQANLGTAGNKNSVDLTYSNNPNIKDDGDPKNPDKPGPESPIGKTPESDTYTYVTGLELTKVNENGEKLTGAEFKITGTRVNTVVIKETEFVEDEAGEYWKLLNGDYTKTAPVEVGDETDTTKHYDSTTRKYKEVVTTGIKTKEENVDITAAVDQNGVLRFDGLSAGEYEITEIKAPNGYNILSDPITVKINWEAPKTGSTDCAWSGKYWDSAKWEPERDNLELINGVLPFEVENRIGSILPETGGIGTTIFYVLGSILALGAGIVLITRRRMKAEQ